jgi:Arc/MetJ family transcription regulator
MRTNIDLDDALMKLAGAYSTASSKRALVHEALETYICVKAEEKKVSGYRQALETFRKEHPSIKSSISSVDLIRKDRERT